MDIFTKVSQPGEYYRTFLEQDCRPDGRQLHEFREIIINVGCISTAEGSSLVKLGETSVICGIKLELATPKEDEPNNGFIIPNVDLPALCSPQFKTGPPSELAQTTSHFMQQLIISSQCVQLSDLGIATGKVCWVLYCDMICLNYDGNLLDACTLSLISALRNVALPVATYNEETGQTDVDLTHKVPLKMADIPVSTTFSVFDTTDLSEKIVVTDPTSEEECLAAGCVTVVTASNSQLCMLHKPGGSSVTDSKLKTCIELALSRTSIVQSLIDTHTHSHTQTLLS